MCATKKARGIEGSYPIDPLHEDPEDREHQDPEGDGEQVVHHGRHSWDADRDALMTIVRGGHNDCVTTTAERAVRLAHDPPTWLAGRMSYLASTPRPRRSRPGCSARGNGAPSPGHPSACCPTAASTSSGSRGRARGSSARTRPRSSSRSRPVAASSAHQSARRGAVAARGARRGAARRLGPSGRRLAGCRRRGWPASSTTNIPDPLVALRAALQARRARAEAPDPLVREAVWPARARRRAASSPNRRRAATSASASCADACRRRSATARSGSRGCCGSAAALGRPAPASELAERGDRRPGTLTRRTSRTSAARSRGARARGCSVASANDGRFRQDGRRGGA